MNNIQLLDVVIVFGSVAIVIVPLKLILYWIRRNWNKNGILVYPESYLKELRRQRYEKIVNSIRKLLCTMYIFLRHGKIEKKLEK